jgi:ATP-binding cassette subfamily C protein CydC
VFRYLERLVSHNVTFRLLARLRVWIYENLEPLAPARLIDYRSGDLLSRIVADVETLENFYIRVVSPPLTALLIAAGTAIFLSFFSPLLSVVLLALFLSLGLFLPWLSYTLSLEPAAGLVRNRAALHGKLVDGILGMADVLAFNRSAHLAGQIAAISQAYGMAQGRLARISALQAGLVTFLTNLGLWLALLIAIPLVNARELNGVMLAPLALLTLAAFEAVTPLPLAAQMWGVTCEAANRLFQIVDTPAEVVDHPMARSISVADLGGEVGIEFDHLSFTYPGQHEPALRDVSFRVQPGQVAAIVGPSGAGKSTLAQLLLRFWDFSRGGISIAGVSIRDYAQDDVRAMIGLVSQNAHFFNTNVYENLRFAGRRISNQEIELAARAALMDETICRMPQEYRTLLGSQGQRLSGGERQRLAIARMLLKDAPIVILDEPTANLDPITERQVLATLFGLLKGKMTLLITHRLVGMENVDQILVMDGGRVVERGTHAALLQKQGLYRRLWDLQNRLLVEDHQIPH